MLERQRAARAAGAADDGDGRRDDERARAADDEDGERGVDGVRPGPAEKRRRRERRGTEQKKRGNDRESFLDKIVHPKTSKIFLFAKRKILFSK